MADIKKIAKKYQILMCEDVRQEVGNKFSLMGLYSGEIIVNKLPSFIRSLAFVLMLEDVLKSFKKISAKLFLPGEKKPLEILIEQPAESKSFKNRNIIVGFSPIRIEKTGTATVQFRFDDDKRPKYSYKFKISVAGEKSGKS